MQPLPANDLRSNLATWAVTPPDLPAVAAALLRALPAEEYDPDFRGQRLTTTYFDTRSFALRKARRQGGRYLTLRLRRYDPAGGEATFALSAKTEAAKWRLEVPAEEAAAALAAGDVTVWAASKLPGNLRARLIELTDAAPLLAVVAVGCRRYACEGPESRLTLDTRVTTDTGRVLPFDVLEYKGAGGADLPAFAADLGLRPVKLSKFLWATGGGR